MPLRIRDFRRQDFNRLWHIDQACFEPGISYTRVELAHYMASNGAFTLVAEKEAESRGDKRLSASAENIVGFVVAQRDRRGRGHIVTIDVIAGARRSGIGSRLLEASEARLTELKCDLIYLETAVNNEPAIAFYQRHGYKNLQTIPRYYHGELDAYLMAKKLST